MRHNHAMARYQFKVEVHPQHLADQSVPSRGLYSFAYTVTITNTGEVAAQLISRTWHINDANGLHERVKGLGVVGHQPLLQPGESFEYTSGTRLRTPTGTMHGAISAWPKTVKNSTSTFQCSFSMPSQTAHNDRYTEPHHGRIRPH